VAHLSLWRRRNSKPNTPISTDSNMNPHSDSVGIGWLGAGGGGITTALTV
jgi:hypothetical protein